MHAPWFLFLFAHPLLSRAVFVSLIPASDWTFLCQVAALPVFSRL